MTKIPTRLLALLLACGLLAGCRPTVTPSQPVQGTTPNTTTTTVTTTTPPPTTTTQPAPESWIIEGVPVIAQRPAYPTGCESVSAVMALQFAGEDISVDTFIDKHLEKDSEFYVEDERRYGPDPYEVFVGDPRTESSYGCMAPVIEKAMNHYFGSDDRVQNTTGTTMEQLCAQYICRGIPVLVWVSIGMLEIFPTSSWYLPSGELFTWPANEHCMVLVGYDATYYYLNDPYTGRQVKHRRSLVEQRYETLDRQSVVVLKENAD